MDDLLSKYGQYLPPAVFGVLLLAYYLDKRKDRKRSPGGKRNENFKRPNSVQVSWKKAISVPRFRTGDNNICGQTSGGSIISAMGDLNTSDGRPGSDTVFYEMAHVGAQIKKIWTADGKCNGVYCKGNNVYALKSRKGSTWLGTQNVEWYDVRRKQSISPTLNKISGFNNMDVFATAATHGWGNEWQGKQMYIFAVNANKQKFDDFQAGIDVYIGDAESPFNLDRYRAGGKIVDRNGKMVAGTRNNHTNYISVAWDNRFGTYILWLSDFFEKTWECWYWDRPRAQDNIARGWVRFYRAPPGNSNTWNQAYQKLKLPKSSLINWQGDRYYSGFWGMNPVRDSKRGNLIASGGWGGDNSPFDQGMFLPGGVV